MEKLIDYFFLPFLRDKLASLDEVTREVEARSTALQVLQTKPLQRNVSQLGYTEVVKIFRLKRDHRQPVFAFEEQELMPIPVPKRLKKDLKGLQEFLLADPQNEATSRLRLDEILKSCTRDERATRQDKTRLKRRIICTLGSDLTVVVKSGRRLELLTSSRSTSIQYGTISIIWELTWRLLG